MESADRREGADWLKALAVEQAPDAVIVADPDGVIRLWNAAAETIFGHAATEVIGRSLDVIIPERLRPAHWRGFESAMTAAKTRYAGQSLPTRAVHKDGHALYVEMSFAILKDAAGAVLGAVAIARDATERHRQDVAIRERLRSLEAGSANAR